MRRLLTVSLILSISTLPLTMNLALPAGLFEGASAASGIGLIPGGRLEEIRERFSVRDLEPDSRPYFRDVIQEDFTLLGRPATSPGVFVRDVVVSNLDSTLKDTDRQNDTEPAIAINPQSPLEIVISAFAEKWTGPKVTPNAPVWHSTDGGVTWAKWYSVPQPDLRDSEARTCPCDQTLDFDRQNRLTGAFLGKSVIFTGASTNAASHTSWRWLLDEYGKAAKTDDGDSSDQPWLLVNRDTENREQDNIYVAYDDFTTRPPAMRVAVSKGVYPPVFASPKKSGASGGQHVNPGHRLAVDPTSGYVYSLFQNSTGAGKESSWNINYMLNRSTDSGDSWDLNGSEEGIVVANADSTQGCATPEGCPVTKEDCDASPNTYKFGTVNALIGGVVHAAVDPTNGDLYYVYGNRDPRTGKNRLGIRRIRTDAVGAVTVGPEEFVTGQVQAALPSVAVAGDRTVGVLYTQYDEVQVSGYPMFSVHLALSFDKGRTFNRVLLLRFLAAAKDNGECRQRVLGDYQQLKVLGSTFYGVFTGNGVSFGRPFADHDPIFFKVRTDELRLKERAGQNLVLTDD